jgi:hypothetical protein
MFANFNVSDADVEVITRDELSPYPDSRVQVHPLRALLTGMTCSKAVITSVDHRKWW